MPSPFVNLCACVCVCGGGGGGGMKVELFNSSVKTDADRTNTMRTHAGQF